MRQKSRTLWLQLGDQNTAYFHRQIKVQQAHNYVRSLTDNSGNLVHNVTYIKTVAISYFQDLLGSADPNVNSTPSMLAKTQQKTLSENSMGALNAEVTGSEMKKCALLTKRQ